MLKVRPTSLLIAATALLVGCSSETASEAPQAPELATREQAVAVSNPVLSSPGWSVTSTQTASVASYVFGETAFVAGDVNGDGYDDVAIPSPHYTVGGTRTGAVLVYHGSTGGLSSTIDATLTGTAGIDLYGLGLSAAGDVNGDGYDDLLVVGRDLGTLGGKVFLHYGSATGLGAAADIGYSSPSTWVPMSAAGDADGDGYDDFVIGYPQVTGGKGAVRLYRGGASALNPQGYVFGTQAGEAFGNSVHPAGDINGDGFDDVLVGSSSFDAAAGTGAGRMSLLLGSATGLASTISWSAEGNSASEGLGLYVRGIGDVNGDGYLDVAAANWNYELKAFYGSAQGLSTSADWTASPNPPYYSWDSLEAVGDINGDGYDDIATGSASYANGEADEGVVRVVYGGPGGLDLSRGWRVQGNLVGAEICCGAGGGDFDGDGYDDLLVPVGYHYDDAGNAVRTGLAWAYYGSDNYAPHPTADELGVDEDASTFIYVTANDTDIEGDDFTAALETAPAHGTATVQTDGRLTYAPDPDYVGADSLTYRVTDTHGAWDIGTVEITVRPEPDPPVFTSPPPPATVAAGALYRVTLTADDPDLHDPGSTETLSFDEWYLPGWLTLTDHGDGTATLEGTPSAADVGSYTFYVYASDGDWSTSDARLLVTLTVVSNNTPPVLTPIGDRTVAEDSLFTLTVMATDADAGDTLTMTATGRPSWLAFNGTTGRFSGTPDDADIGTSTITVAVSDGEATVSETFTLTVTAVNDAPVLAAIGSQSAAEDSAFAMMVRASDEDAGDTLTYGATGLPGWLSLDATSGALGGTPRNADVGTAQITVTVRDAAGATDARSFGLTVTNTNDAPVLVAPTPAAGATLPVVEGALLEFTVRADDVDPGDQVTLAATGLPASASFNPSTGLARLTPTWRDAGTYAVTLRATDRAGATDSRQITVQVTFVDADADEVPDSLEGDLGMDASTPDSDGDFIADADEVGDLSNPADTDHDGTIDALDDDSDGDGVPDSAEAGDVVLTNPPRDTDGDGVPDYRDEDSDGDGTGDAVDNCRLVINADQADADGDGIGDACADDIDGDGLTNAEETALGTSPTSSDSDGDGLSDSVEVGDSSAPADTDHDGTIDALDEDSDGDGVPDSEEAAGGVVDTDDDGLADHLDPDSDGDGVADGTDNCRRTANADQSDLDQDGAGDVCDPDDDGDGIDDAADNCPEVANPDQVDADGDGLGAACDEDDGGSGGPDGGSGGPDGGSGGPDGGSGDPDGGVSDPDAGGSDPDAGSGPDAGGYDGGIPDSGSGSAGADSGGCSTAGGTGTAESFLLVLLGLILVRLRAPKESR